MTYNWRPVGEDGINFVMASMPVAGGSMFPVLGEPPPNRALPANQVPMMKQNHMNLNSSMDRDAGDWRGEDRLPHDRNLHSDRMPLERRFEGGPMPEKQPVGMSNVAVIDYQHKTREDSLDVVERVEKRYSPHDVQDISGSGPSKKMRYNEDFGQAEYGMERNMPNKFLNVTPQNAGSGVVLRSILKKSKCSSEDLGREQKGREDGRHDDTLIKHAAEVYGSSCQGNTHVPENAQTYRLAPTSTQEDSRLRSIPYSERQSPLRSVEGGSSFGRSPDHQSRLCREDNWTPVSDNQRDSYLYTPDTVSLDERELYVDSYTDERGSLAQWNSRQSPRQRSLDRRNDRQSPTRTSQDRRDDRQTANQISRDRDDIQSPNQRSRDRRNDGQTPNQRSHNKDDIQSPNHRSLDRRDDRHSRSRRSCDGRDDIQSPRWRSHDRLSPSWRSYDKEDDQQSPSRGSHDRRYDRLSPNRISCDRRDNRQSPSRRSHDRRDGRPSPSRSPYERRVDIQSPSWISHDRLSPTCRSSYNRQSPSRRSHHRKDDSQSPSRRSRDRNESRQSPVLRSHDRRENKQSPSQRSHNRRDDIHSSIWISHDRQSPCRRSCDRNEGRQSPILRSHDRREERQSPSRRSHDRREDRQSPSWISHGRQSPSRRSSDRRDDRLSPSLRSRVRKEDRQSPSLRSHDRRDGRFSPSRRSCDRRDDRFSPTRRSYDRRDDRFSTSRRSCDRRDDRFSPSRRSCDRTDDRFSTSRRSCDRTDDRFSPSRRSCDGRDDRFSPSLRSYDTRDDRQSPRRGFSEILPDRRDTDQSPSEDFLFDRPRKSPNRNFRDEFSPEDRKTHDSYRAYRHYPIRVSRDKRRSPNRRLRESSRSSRMLRKYSSPPNSPTRHRSCDRDQTDQGQHRSCDRDQSDQGWADFDDKWKCTGCGWKNYQKRVRCYRCVKMREETTEEANSTVYPPWAINPMDTPENGRKSIRVSNLPLSVSAKELFNLYSKCGSVVYTNIITDQVTKRSKGYGFVFFNKVSEAEYAVTKTLSLTGNRIYSNLVKVMEKLSTSYDDISSDEEVSGPKFKCQVDCCGFQGTQQQFHHHWKEIHSSFTKLLICPVCDTGCADCSAMRSHLMQGHGVTNEGETMNNILGNIKMELRRNIFYVNPGCSKKEAMVEISCKSGSAKKSFRTLKVYKCPEKGCLFAASTNSFIRHWNSKHLETSSVVLCPVCSVNCVEKTKLIEHFRIEHKIHPYVDERVIGHKVADAEEISSDEDEEEFKMLSGRFICQVAACDFHGPESAFFHHWEERHVLNQTYLQCPYCSIACNDQPRIRYHMVRMHKVQVTDPILDDALTRTFIKERRNPNFLDPGNVEREGKIEIWVGKGPSSLRQKKTLRSKSAAEYLREKKSTRKTSKTTKEEVSIVNNPPDYLLMKYNGQKTYSIKTFLAWSDGLIEKLEMAHQNAQKKLQEYDKKNSKLQDLKKHNSKLEEPDDKSQLKELQTSNPQELENKGDLQELPENIKIQLQEREENIEMQEVEDSKNQGPENIELQEHAENSKLQKLDDENIELQDLENCELKNTEENSELKETGEENSKLQDIDEENSEVQDLEDSGHKNMDEICELQELEDNSELQEFDEENNELQEIDEEVSEVQDLEDSELQNMEEISELQELDGNSELQDLEEKSELHELEDNSELQEIDENSELQEINEENRELQNVEENNELHHMEENSELQELDEENSEFQEIEDSELQDLESSEPQELDEENNEFQVIDEENSELQETDEENIEFQVIDEENSELQEIDEENIELQEIDEENIEFQVIDEENSDFQEIDEENSELQDLDEENSELQETDEENGELQEIDEEKSELQDLEENDELQDLEESSELQELEENSELQDHENCEMQEFNEENSS